MSGLINANRRNFLQAAGSGVAALAASQLGLIQSAVAQTATASPAPLGPIRQINADTLNVGYYETGPATGPVVILLHGWPYDIHSFAEVAPLLAAKGYRVIVPHLRGYGTTTFLSADTPRNGQQAVLAMDIRYGRCAFRSARSGASRRTANAASFRRPRLRWSSHTRRYRSRSIQCRSSGNPGPRKPDAACR